MQWSMAVRQLGGKPGDVKDRQTWLTPAGLRERRRGPRWRRKVIRLIRTVTTCVPWGGWWRFPGLPVMRGKWAAAAGWVGAESGGEPVSDRPSVGCRRRSPPCRAWSRSDRGTPVRMARSGLAGAISGTARSACRTSPALARFGRSGSCLAQLVVKEGICGVDARKTQTRKARPRRRELLGIGPSTAIRVANRGGCRDRGAQIVAPIPRRPPLAVPAHREREHPSRAGRRLWKLTPLNAA